MADIPTFECIIVGDGGVGKTTFIKKHLTSEFTQIYNPILDTVVHALVFNTTHGRIRFNVRTCVEQEIYSGLGNEYYVQVQCAIVMFDLTNRRSYVNSKRWYNEIANACSDIPIIIVGNKADTDNRKVTSNEIEFNHDMYYDISSKSSYNCEKPFLALMRILMNDTTIQSIPEVQPIS